MKTVVKGLTPTVNKKETATTPKETEKKQEAQKSSTMINEIINPTAEARIKKMQNMIILADKHAFLKEKSDELEKFILSSDGTKEKITLSNAKGFTLDITNSQVVEEVTEVCKKIISRFLEDSEKSILSYHV